MTLKNNSIYLKQNHLIEIIGHLDSELPNEGCGFIAGKNNTSSKVYLIKNVLNSPTRFQMHPKQQIDSIIEMQAKNWELIAIFHSHPNGPPHPSPTDLKETNYLEAAQIIFSFQNKLWAYKGFIIKNGEFQEIAVSICE